MLRLSLIQTVLVLVKLAHILLHFLDSQVTVYDGDDFNFADVLNYLLLNLKLKQIVICYQYLGLEILLRKDIEDRLVAFV